MSQVHMQQIADAARLTRATVSRALRNDPRISEATRRRVEELAASLGYRSNPYISTLMASLRRGAPSSVSPVIAFLNPRTSRDSWRLNVPWAAMYEGAAARAQALGFQLEEFWIGDPAMPASRVSMILHARGIRAAILAIAESEQQSLNIDLSSMAAVAIDIDPVQKQLNRVSTDYFGNTLLALHSMRALGFKRIGLALIDWHPGYTKNLTRAALLEFQEELPSADRAGYWLGAPQDLVGFAHWLEDQKPDAIVTTHWHPQAWLQSLGFRIPVDISVAQLDPGAVKFPLSGIDGRYAEVGAAAVDLLLNQIQHHEFAPPPHPKQILHSGEWRPGWSARPRASAPRLELYDECRLAVLSAVRSGNAASLAAARRPLLAQLHAEAFPETPAVDAASWRPLSLARIANGTVRTPDSFSWLPEQDRLNLPVGVQAIRGVPFTLPDETAARHDVAHLVINRRTEEYSPRSHDRVELPVEERVRSLFVLHAAFYIEGPTTAAEYRWIFADGHEHGVPVRPFFPPESDAEIAAIQDSWPAIPQFESAFAKPLFIASDEQPCRHDRVCYVWNMPNPRPEAVVRALRISPVGGSSAVVLILGVTALRAES